MKLFIISLLFLPILMFSQVTSDPLSKPKRDDILNIKPIPDSIDMIIAPRLRSGNLSWYKTSVQTWWANLPDDTKDYILGYVRSGVGFYTPTNGSTSDTILFSEVLLNNKAEYHIFLGAAYTSSPLDTIWQIKNDLTTAELYDLSGVKICYTMTYPPPHDIDVEVGLSSNSYWHTDSGFVFFGGNVSGQSVITTATVKSLDLTGTQCFIIRSLDAAQPAMLIPYAEYLGSNISN